MCKQCPRSHDTDSICSHGSYCLCLFRHFKLPIAFVLLFMCTSVCLFRVRLQKCWMNLVEILRRNEALSNTYNVAVSKISWYRFPHFDSDNLRFSHCQTEKRGGGHSLGLLESHLTAIIWKIVNCSILYQWRLYNLTNTQGAFRKCKGLGSCPQGRPREAIYVVFWLFISTVNIKAQSVLKTVPFVFLCNSYSS